MRNKKLLFITGIFLLIIMLSGCKKSQQQSVGEDDLSKLKPIKITIAHSEAGDPANHMHAGSLAFKEYVEAQSKGKITVEVSPGGALGDADSTMQQCMAGTLEIAGSIADGSLSSVYPDFLMWSIPYLFDNEEQAIEVYHSKFGQKMWKGFTKKTNLYPLATLSEGFRHFTNNKRNIKTAADLKGLQIRTMKMPAHIELVKTLGGVATPISWTELYSALQQGVVDGQENGIPTLVMSKIWEVQKYLTLDGHVWTTGVWVMSKKWFDKLPKPYRQIVREGGMVMQEVGQRYCYVETRIGMSILPKKMKVYVPTPDEIKTFRDACQQPVADFIKSKVKHPELVDQVIKEADQALVRMGFKN
jgi:tripartite ATP-independent transporter DctP family solute receptor